MKNLLTFIVLFCLSTGQLMAQCDTPAPPGLSCDEAPLFCIEDLDGFCSTLPDTTDQTMPNPLCIMGGVPSNIQWIAFVASSSEMEIEITPSNCMEQQPGLNGMQAGIYLDCSFSGGEIVCSEFCSTDPILLAPTLIVGDIYYLFVDGCAAAICDYSIEVTNGMPAPTDVSAEYCEGESFTYPGDGMDYLAGVYAITLPGASSIGCDSLIHLTVTENPVDETYLGYTLCPEDSITVGGVIYNQTNPIGQVTLTNEFGCDSIITVDLTFLPEAISTIDFLLCSSEFVNVAGVIYDEANPQGIEILEDASVNGCDSIIVIDLEFLPENNTLIADILCDDEIVNVAGTNYDSSNPTGTEVLIDMYGCDSVITIDLTFVPAGEPYIFNEQTTNETCSGAANGSFCFEVICGTPPYTYIWSNASTDMCQTNLDPGTYTVTVTDALGVTAQQDVIIDMSPAIILAGNYGDVTCNGGSDGFIDVTVTGGTPPYIFNPSSSLQDLAAGNYTVTVTDANDCTSAQTFSIVEPNPIEGIFQSNVTSCDTYCLEIMASGGSGAYMEEWSTGQIGGIEICDLSSGFYSVTITDTEACSEVFGTTIADPDPISIVANTIICPTVGNSDGSIDIDLTGGALPFDYEWSNGAFTQDISGLSNGVYVVTITDDNNCTAEASFELGNDLTISNVATADVSCNGDSDGAICLEVSCGTAPYTYNWSGGLPDTDCPADLAAGTYEVTITDASSNTIVESFVVDEPALIVPIISGPTQVCDGEQITLCIDAPTGPNYSYIWSGPAGFTSTDVCITLTMDVGAEGCYTVEVIDANGCTASTSHCVEVTTLSDVLNAPIEDAYICGGATHQFDVDAPTATAISWTPAIGLSCDDCFDPIASPAATTIYTATITSADACLFTEEVTVSVDEEAVINVVGPLLVCAGADFAGCVNVDIGGGPIVSSVWTTPMGTIVGECLDIADVSTANAGFYEVTVTFQSGCTASTDFTLEVDEVFFTISDDVMVCADVPTTLEGSGTDIASINWSPGDYLSCTDCLEPVATPLTSTIYTATISSLNGCTADAEVTVTVDENCVWPGDTDTNKVVNNYDLLNIGLAYDSIGPVRPGANLMWVGQEAPNWTQTAPNGSNYKHIDTDGNGLIDANDTLAVSQNWGEVHNFTGDDDVEFMPTYPPSNGGSVTVPFYVQPDTLVEGQMMSLPVILGEAGNPMEDLYGIAFTLEYDTAVIVPGSVYMGFDQSWLGENNDNLISMHRDFFNDNKVDIGMTRIDGTPMTDFGTLARLFITVEDDLLFTSGGSGNFGATQDEALFRITNVLAINNLGEEVDVIPMETTAQVETTTSTHNPALGDHISIYPNPATDLLWINTKNIKLERIELWNIQGQVVTQLIQPSAQQKVELNELGAGTYFVKVYAEEGVYVERIVLVK